MITRRQFLYRTAIGCGLVGSGLLSWARFGELHWLEVVRRDLVLEGLPEVLRGETLLQLSDLHVGHIVDEAYILHALELGAAERPAISVFTGDFVSWQSAGQLPQLERVLRRFPRGRLATLAILGNHDYGWRWSQRDVANRVADLARACGLDVLRNEAREVGGLQIVGFDDFWSPNWRPARALAECRPERPALALCHNPDGVDEPVWSNFRGYVLSGHTHGGQCKPPFLPPPLLPVRNRRYTAGEFDLVGSRCLYINRAVGHLLPVRFNVRPEITVHRLVRSAT